MFILLVLEIENVTKFLYNKNAIVLKKIVIEIQF